MKGILPDKVIFFDGYCILCSKFVDFIIKHDRSGSFKFCPLQSETAKLALTDIGYPASAVSDMDNVVYIRDGKLKIKSDAALAILSDIGGILKVAVTLYVIPRYLRDKVYDACAKRRYGWFGKSKFCYIIQPDNMIIILE